MHSSYLWDGVVCVGLLAALIVLVVLFVLDNYYKTRNLCLPPGPKAWPFLGNLPCIVGKDLHQVLTNLGTRFGSLVWLKLGPDNVLVVNSMNTAVECFVRNGKSFGGRPRKRKTIEVLLGDGTDVIMGDIGPELKLHRKTVHSFLASQNSFRKDRLAGILQQEGKSLALAFRTFSASGEAFDPRLEVSRVVANVLCQSVLNRRFESVDSTFRDQLSIVQDIINNIESFNVVDLFPWLQHFPISSWRRFKKSLEKRDEWIKKIIQEHRNVQTEGKPQDLLGIFLKLQSDAKENHDSSTAAILSDVSIGNIVHELFGGGIESTTVTILWLIIYLLHNPKWQKQIYEELAENGGMPCIMDMNRYPVLKAVVKETLRLACILPVGFPHKTMDDTSISGYHIPKDTMVIMNIWAIHHDEKEWVDPYSFNPDRFLNENGERSRSYLPFGLGPRVCLGSHVARMEIMTFCAYVLSEFEIKPADGLPNLKGISGLTMRPKPFNINLIPRMKIH